jgi:hypothetical protein
VTDVQFTVDLQRQELIEVRPCDDCDTWELGARLEMKSDSLMTSSAVARGGRATIVVEG